MQKITPFLWFDHQAEEAARFYVSIFKDAKLGTITRYCTESGAIHDREPGSVMTVVFEIEGQKFTALNGGPVFKFNEAISFVVHCRTQEEIDYYWQELSSGGHPAAQQCGWLEDRFGVSWQIVPPILIELLQDKDATKANRGMKAMLQMKKIDIQRLIDAYGQ